MSALATLACAAAKRPLPVTAAPFVERLMSMRSGDGERQAAPPSCRPSWLDRFEPPREARPTSAPLWTDCGDPDCPYSERCRAIIAARAEAEHKAAARRVRRLDDLWRSRQWIAEVYGTGEERGPAQRQRYTRPSRSKPKLPPRRKHVPLTQDEEHAALAMLAEHPIRRTYEREEWMAETWRELVEPPANVKPPTDFNTRVTRAIARAEYRLRILHRREIVPGDCPKTSLAIEAR